MTQSVVIDTSVIVDVLLEPARRIVLLAAVAERAVIAPCHIDAEVTSALARLYREGKLSDEAVRQRLGLLASMKIERSPLGSLALPAWDLKDNVAVLDALYVALAEERDTVVLTTDARLSRAHHRAELLDWTASH